MIEQLKHYGLVAQSYFLSLCHYISFYIKRLGSLTTTTSIDTGGISGKSASVGLNNQINFRNHNISVNVSANDKKQNHPTNNNNKLKYKPSSQIPGTKCLPVFGTLFDFNKYGSRRVHELSVERHAQYGDIFREKLLSQELVFVASTDLLKQWMAQEGKLPMSLKQEPSLVFAECCPHLKRGLFFRNGDEWNKLRKLGHSIIHKNTSDFESHGLYDAAEEFFEGYMKTLQQTVRKSENGLIDDVEMRSYAIAVGATLRVVYGKNADKFQSYTGTDLATLSRNARDLNEDHQQLLEIPPKVAKWLRMPAWTSYATKLHHNLTACLKFTERLREDILKSPEEASMRSHGLLYKTLNLIAPLQDIDDLLTDFAVDTKDPFAGTVMFVTHVFAMHPEIQEKIYEEVSQVYPSNQSITYGKLKYLEYTEGFIKEVLRLYPVAPFTARVTLEDTVVGEYLVKPGTKIIYSTYVAHRDPRYFTNPLKVLPERWIDAGKSKGHLQNGVSNGGITSSHNYQVCDTNAFAPFGLKSRSCLGQNIAIPLFVLYVANLARKFKLTSTGSPEISMRTVLYAVNQKPIQFKIR